MLRCATVIFAFTAAVPFSGCGVADTRDQVVYPYYRPIPRAAEYRAPQVQPPVAQPAAEKTSYDACPGDAEELAEGSICPPTAQCFEISGGRRCIVYAK